MQIAEALAFLDRHIDLEKQTAVAGRVEGLSLDPLRALLHALADPQEGLPVVHVTGTNGKGSVARMVAEILAAHGLKVGLYTSPHLQRINERLWTSDTGAIDDDALAAVLTDLANAAPLAGVDLSWFELVTAAALVWFAQEAVDVAVVEVGLLGRFDATNVVDGDVAVITNVGQDHTDFAPGWREQVAWEKAGIVKPTSFLVLGETDPDLRPVFEEAAGTDEVGNPRLWVAGEDFTVELDRTAVGGRLLDVRTPGAHYEELFVPVQGARQAENAAVAIAAAEAFFARPLDEAVVEAGLARVRLPGRVEIVGHQPLVVVDGAHNPESAQALTEVLEDDLVVEGRTTLVIGTLGGRDLDALLDALDVGSADEVVATEPASPRARPADEVAEAVRARGVPVRVEPVVADAVRQAVEEAGEEDLVAVTGSLHTAGEARAALGCEPPGTRT